MKLFLSSTIASVIILAGGCTSQNTPIRTALLGDPADNAAAERVIVIESQTRYVNVTGGEIIKFDVGDKSFTWHFDGALSVTNFPLQQVAPAGVLDHAVTAYVRPNPLFIGGDRN